MTLPGYGTDNLGFDTGLHFRPLFSIHHYCLESDIFADLRTSQATQVSSTPV